MNKIVASIIFLVFIICLFSIKGFAIKINDYGLNFGGQEQFSGYIDYNFFSKLSTCTPYTTPTVMSAPLGVSNGYYKSQIIGLQEGKCIVKNFSNIDSSWKVTTIADG
jgi:hypothetical protein